MARKSTRSTRKASARKQPAVNALIAQLAVALGVSKAQVRQLTAQYGEPKPKAEPKPTPDWIIERGKNKASNRALAGALRELGIAPNGAAWDEAKALVAQGKSPNEAAALVAQA